MPSIVGTRGERFSKLKKQKHSQVSVSYKGVCDIKKMYLFIFILFFTVPQVFSTVISSYEQPSQDDSYCLVKYLNHTFDFSGLTKYDEDAIFKLDNDKNESIRVHFCRSLYHPCGTGAGYAVCLHMNDGREVGVGRERPKVSTESGKILFRYTGEKCNETHDYTATFEMKCDYSKTDSLYIDSITSYSHHSCDLYAILSTSLACTKRQQFDCTYNENSAHYNLSSLTDYKNNHIIELSNDFTLILNVCHSLIFGPHYEQCNSDSAICLMDKTGLSGIKYRNLGQLNEYSQIYMLDGNLHITYINGSSCENFRWNVLQSTKTTITFICDVNAKKSHIEYVGGLENCHVKLVWVTAAACSEESLLNETMLNRRSCRVKDPLSNYVYDLSYLMEESLHFSPNDDHEYQFSVCASYDSPCKPGTGICKTSRMNPNLRVSGGMANSLLRWSEQGPYLNYTNGDECANGLERYTIIQFACGSSSMVIIEEHECHTIVKWTTKIACKKVCSSYSDEMSIEKLFLTAKDRVIGTNDTRVQFYMNICRSIQPDQFFYCPEGAGICKSTYGDDGKLVNETSLGFPEFVPSVSVGGMSTFRFENGSVCEEDKTKRIASEVEFICDLSIRQGVPEFIYYQKCEYYFEWKSRMACGISDATISKYCIVRNVLGDVWNLIPLYQSSVHKVRSQQLNRTYSIYLCGGEKFCNGSFICDEKVQYGKTKKVHMDYMNELVKFYFGGGSECEDGSQASSILSIKCNEKAGTGEPTLVWEQDCSTEFEWYTDVICDLQSDYYRKAKTIESRTHTRPSEVSAGEIFILMMVISAILGVGYYFYDSTRRDNFVRLVRTYWALYGWRRH